MTDHPPRIIFDFRKAIEQKQKEAEEEQRSIQDIQIDTFIKENGFKEKYAMRLIRNAGEDKRYQDYCMISYSTPQEKFKFRLLLALQIHKEDMQILNEMESRPRTRRLR